MKKVIIPLLFLSLILFNYLPNKVFAYTFKADEPWSTFQPYINANTTYKYYTIVRVDQTYKVGSIYGKDNTKYFIYFSDVPLTYENGINGKPEYTQFTLSNSSGRFYYCVLIYSDNGKEESYSSVYNGANGLSFPTAPVPTSDQITATSKIIYANVDIKSTSGTVIAKQNVINGVGTPYLPQGQLSFVSDNALIEGGTMNFRYSAQIPYNMNYKMSQIQYSFDGTNFKSFFDDSGNASNDVVVNTLTFTKASSLFTGEFVIKFPVELNKVNNCILYMKTPEGVIFQSDTHSMDLINHGGDTMPGSGQSGTDIIGKAPDRANYPDGVLGSVQWGFDTLIYYILFPAKELGYLFSQMVTAISNFVSQASGFNNFMNGMLGGLPVWVTAPFQVLFTITIIMTIIHMVRR